MAWGGWDIAAMTATLAVSVSLAAALAAWQAKALTGSGAFAAAALGTLLLGALGWAGGALLLAFFLPSTLVGRFGARRPSISDARGERRDAVQVLANGGPAAAGALAELFAPGLGVWIAASSLAAASADTWATSTGALGSGEAVHLLTHRPVPQGTSGGVSLAGTLGAIAGGALVAGTAGIVAGSPVLLVAALGIGLGGMFLDSLLGAAWQARFICPACDAVGERRRHRCGTRTRLVEGWRWLDNDAVNAVMTILAGLAGALAWFLH